eukprot:286398_1
MAYFAETSQQPQQVEGNTMGNEPDPALKAWIIEYRLSKIAPILYEEDITLEFLLDQTVEEIKEIATNDLKFTGIQLKKFLHAISKQKPKPEMKEQEQIIVKPINKASSVSDSWYNTIKSNEILIQGKICKNNVSRSTWSNCFGSHTVKQGIYSWKIKVISNSLNNNLAVGVIPSDIESMKKAVWESHPYGYNIYTWSQTVTCDSYGNKKYSEHCQDRKVNRNYGEFCGKPGSEIIGVLNMDDLTLSFVINGTDYGVMTKVDKGSYRLRICFVSANAALELVSSGN